MKTERELFEGRFGKPEHWIEFDAVKNKYTCKYDATDHQLLIRQARWEAWCASASREGYKLVPVEASESMLDAGLNCEHEIDNFVVIDEIYKAMIGAVE